MSKKKQDTVRVFVYGSLKRDYYNHSVMERCGGKFVDEATISGSGYTLVDLGSYPGVILGPDNTGKTKEVHGEVYEVPLEGLRGLDTLEGHPNYYKRFKVKTSLDKGDRTWVYFLPPGKGYERADRVLDGRWAP